MLKLKQVSKVAIAMVSVCLISAQDTMQEEAVFAPQAEEFTPAEHVQEDISLALDDASKSDTPISLPDQNISDVSVQLPSAEMHQQQEDLDNKQSTELISQESIAAQPNLDAAKDLDSSPEEPIGIDTIHLQEPQGNWLFKRIWWERAQQRYEKIRVLVDQIWEMRVGFFLNRSEVDRTKLDPFYLFIGFEQGAVQEELNDLIEKLAQEEQATGILDTEEKTLLLDIQEQKKILEGLRSDIGLISQLDHSIDESLERLMEQINRVRVYERDSWNYFKEIAQVLSDTKARELYYKMDTSWRNIKDIYKYLQNDFLAHFQDIINKLNTELVRVRTLVAGLKEKGFDLKKQSELLKQGPQKPVQVAMDEEDSQESLPERSFFGAIGYSIIDGFSLFWEIVTMPFSYIYHKLVG